MKKKRRYNIQCFQFSNEDKGDILNRRYKNVRKYQIDDFVQVVTVEKIDVHVLREFHWIDFVYTGDRDLTKYPLYKCSDEFTNKNGNIKPH